MRTVCIAALLIAGAAAAHAAATVNVSFVQPDRFTDIGRSPTEREASLKLLEEHLRELGARFLADGQTLSLEVTDVDLAGELRPSSRRATELRVVRGTADWPRIWLRYTLEAGGQAPRRGEAKIDDMNYTRHVPDHGAGDPLRYEKRMLDAWFKATFATSP